MLSEHPSSAVSDRGSELLSGATVSSRMAQSCYGSAGELLAWRPDRVGHEALMGEPVGSHRAFGKGVPRASYNENSDSDAISESASRRKKR